MGAWPKAEYDSVWGKACRLDAEAERPLVALGTLDAALAGMDPKTGRGADCLGPRDVAPPTKGGGELSVVKGLVL